MVNEAIEAIKISEQRLSMTTDLKKYLRIYKVCAIGTKI